LQVLFLPGAGIPVGRASQSGGEEEWHLDERLQVLQVRTVSLRSAVRTG